MSFVKIISGPTGSGKTAVAERFQKPIFSADAFQFYREIPILSNQTTSKSNVHFVADRSIKNPINAGDFSREAAPYLKSDGIWAGIGLYLGAALFGLDEDRKKGTPFQGEPRMPFRMVVLNPERKKLYSDLDHRVDQMCERGAVDEARRIYELKQKGEIESSNPVLKGIGLKHLLEHFDQQRNLNNTIILWKRDTRRLAKRQMTWLRKFCPPSPTCIWVDPAQMDFLTLARFFEI
ncbi:MAG: tRNA dimethylallyltransferase [Bacteriovoracaceae bacterium]|nr:tRNA dimethylallyltransferase [Bacteriovoracaceae bacterium]